MSFKQSICESVLDSSLGTPAFDRAIRANVFLGLCLKADGSPTIFGTATLTVAGVTDSSALCMTLHGHTISSMSAMDLVVAGSINVHKNFVAVPCPFLSQYGEESEIPSTLGFIRSFEYYTWDTQVTNPQSPVFPSGKHVPSPAHMKAEAT